MIRTGSGAAAATHSTPGRTAPPRSTAARHNARRQTPETPFSAKRLRPRRVQVPLWLPPLLLVLFAALYVPVRLMEPTGLPRYRILKEELAQLEARNRELREETRQVQSQVKALRSDPAAIERVAREELGMVRSNEIVLFVDR